MLSSRLTAVSLVLLAVLGIAWFLDTSAQSDRIRSGLSSDSGDPKGLLVHGSADKNTLGSDETLYVDWTFENHSSNQVTVQISFAAPGFENVKLAEPVFSIPPGGLKPMRILLYPLEGGQFRLTGRYKSEGAAGQTVLGPVEVVTLGRRITRIGRQVYTVIKDLALPILLACLAYLFQKRQKERDDRVKQDADDREAEARRLEKERDIANHEREIKRNEQAAGDRELREYRVQVRNIQLPRFQEYAEKHYLPIVGSVRLLRREFDKTWQIGGPSPAQLDLLLYRLAIFLKRMQRLRDERGGVFFQDRRAESILQSAWFCFNHHVEEKLGLERRDAILALTRLDEDFAGFQAKTGNPVVREVLTKLKVWVDMGLDPQRGGLMNCLDLTRIMQSVLSFESNRPLDQYWYDKSEGLDLDGFEAYQIPAEPSDRYAVLKREIPIYREDVRAYLAKRI